jgi:hypothetical protein
VVHRDSPRTYSTFAVGTDRSVLLEKPLSRLRVCIAARRKRRVLVPSAFAFLAWSAWAAFWWGQISEKVNVDGFNTTIIS